MSEHSWEKLIEAHYSRIRRAALLLTGAPWDADDLAQETFLEAAGARRRFQKESGAYTWLYAILLNRVRRWRRRQARRRKLAQLWQRLRHKVEAPADHEIQLREWRQNLWAQVAELSTEHHEVLVLRYAEGLTQEEIAQVVARPTGTVKSRLHHALLALRRRLADEDWANATAAGPPELSMRHDLAGLETRE